jgi:hypothetical protein
MPKKRKTRKAKILTDRKKQVIHETPVSVISSEKKGARQANQQVPMQGMTFSLSTTNTEGQPASRKTQPVAKTTVISTDEYGYLGIDLLKTAIVTAAIVVTEIVIRILFRG